MHPKNSHMTEPLLSMHFVVPSAPLLGKYALKEWVECKGKSAALQVNRSHDMEKRIQSDLKFRGFFHEYGKL